VVVYVLDASAVLRYIDNEAGANRVAELIAEHFSGGNRLLYFRYSMG
jgi:hypothetical protein